MKLLLILFFSLICAFLTKAQNPINSDYRYEEDGYHSETRIDGSTRCQYTIKDGNLDGPRECFHPNGQLWIHETFDKGQFNGTNVSFAENGDTVFVERYQHDTLLYTRNFDYYKKGIIKWIATINYLNDSTLVENPFKTYKRLGRTAIDIRNTELTISNEGWMVQFREDGSVLDSLEITNGLYTGVYKSFFGSLKKKVIANKVDWEYHGDYREFFESGRIKIVAHYSEGKLHGNYIEYDESGEILEESKYEFGKKMR